MVAYCHAKRSNDQRPLSYSKVYSAVDQSFDRAGLRKQIQWCQQMANNIFRRGYCDKCYDSEPPAKRLRVSGTQVCGAACLNNACSLAVVVPVSEWKGGINAQVLNIARPKSYRADREG